MLEGDGELEQALDRALASYGGVPGTDGLETRVLAGVRQRNRRRRMWQWTGAAALAAAAMICAMFWPVTRVDTRLGPVGTAQMTAASLPIARLPQQHLEIAWTPAKQRRSFRKRSEPRLGQFPTPYPMTDEEHALLRLAELRSARKIKEVPVLGAPIQPIEIATLQIKSIDPVRKLEE